MQVKGLEDEVGNEAARLLNEMICGGRELSATVVQGHFSSGQPVQVSYKLEIAACCSLNSLKP